MGSTPGIVDNSNATAITIDSSERVFIGKTATGLGTSGTEINPNGYVQITEDQSPPLYLNRLSTDGSIVNFYKDGTTVGSIGSTTSAGGGSRFAIGGNSDPGIIFAGTGVFPASGITASDGAADLGSSSYRWKDLYLSGEAKATSTGVDGTYAPILRGVYSGNSNETNTIETSVSSVAAGSGFKFNVSNGGGSSGQTEGLRITRDGLYAPLGIKLGGTGAANKLDDYEEGTWSPAIRGDGSWSAGTQGYTRRNGNYVKVGSFVYLAFDVQVNGLGTVAGSYLQIGNFPFSVENSNLGGGNVSYYSSLSNTSGPLLLYAAATQGYLMEGATTYVALSDATASTRLIGTIMYKTTQ